jgi:hypothetical protein
VPGSLPGSHTPLFSFTAMVVLTLFFSFLVVLSLILVRQLSPRFTFSLLPTLSFRLHKLVIILSSAVLIITFLELSPAPGPIEAALRAQFFPLAALPNHLTSPCSDTVGARTLLGSYIVNAAANTIETCVASCNAAGFYYAGLEYGQVSPCCLSCCLWLTNPCSARNVSAEITSRTTVSPLPYLIALSLAQATPGNSAVRAIGSVFTRKGVHHLPHMHRVSPNGGTWGVGGAFPLPSHHCLTHLHLAFSSDSVTARSLSVRKTVTGGMTVEACTAACRASGYTLAGVEYSTECYCSNAFSNQPVQEPDSDCNMACSGNAAGLFCLKKTLLAQQTMTWFHFPLKSEKCGGPDRLNVYTFTTPPAQQWKSLGCIRQVHGLDHLPNVRD